MRATCTMEGDAYEMEDQRNWTDASYKTYIRPLAKPRPYTVRGGEAIRQSVSLTFRGAPSAAVATADAASASIGAPTGRPMPRLGLWVPPAEAERSIAVAELIKDLGPTCWSVGSTCAIRRRCRCAGSSAGAGRGRGRAGRARDRAAERAAGRGAGRSRRGGTRRRARARGRRAVAPGVPQELAAPGAVACVSAARGLYDAARQAFPGVLVGGGMLSYFTELNRKRRPPGTSTSSRIPRARSCTTATTARHGDPRGAALGGRDRALVRPGQALSRRTQHARHARQSLWRRADAQPGEPADRHGAQRSAPARPVRRRLEPRLRGAWRRPASRR